jgi:hypothetical protein
MTWGLDLPHPWYWVCRRPDEATSEVNPRQAKASFDFDAGLTPLQESVVFSLGVVCSSPSRIVIVSAAAKAGAIP